MQAVLTLFELGTLDNWGDTLFAAMDIRGTDQQPRRNAQWQNAIFFIVFICVSAHFMIKCFVGVFCEQVSQKIQKHHHNRSITGFASQALLPSFMLRTAGVEPAIFGFEDRRLIH